MGNGRYIWANGCNALTNSNECLIFSFIYFLLEIIQSFDFYVQHYHKWSGYCPITIGENRYCNRRLSDDKHVNIHLKASTEIINSYLNRREFVSTRVK